MFRVLVVSLSISLVTSFCQGTEKTPRKPKPKATPLEKQTKKVLEEGFEGGQRCAARLGMEGSQAYSFDGLAEESVDGKLRYFQVVLATGTQQDQPVALCLTSLEKGRRTPDDIELTTFRATLKGVLQAAAYAEGSVTTDGKSIDGGGADRIVELDPKAADTKAKFQYELDYWVKGKYRKKKQPEKKPAEK